jgi:hypothetical protein
LQVRAAVPSSLSKRTRAGARPKPTCVRDRVVGGATLIRATSYSFCRFDLLPSVFTFGLTPYEFGACSPRRLYPGFASWAAFFRRFAAEGGLTAARFALPSGYDTDSESWLCVHTWWRESEPARNSIASRAIRGPHDANCWLFRGIDGKSRIPYHPASFRSNRSPHPGALGFQDNFCLPRPLFAFERAR